MPPGRGPLSSRLVNSFKRYKSNYLSWQGLEEVQVHSKSEVYSILEKGSDKRKAAETFMNAQSREKRT